MTRTLNPKTASVQNARANRIPANSIPAGAGSLLAGASALAGLPVLGRWAWSALTLAPGCDGYTAVLLHALLLFALVAAAVTGLFGLACGLGGLLRPADAA